MGLDKHHGKCLAAPALHMEFSDTLQGSIQLTLEFISIDKDPNWNQGVKGSGNNGAVPDVYFPMRKGCHVTLYNDAHVVSNAGAARGMYSSPAKGFWAMPLDSDALCTAVMSLMPASLRRQAKEPVLVSVVR